MELVGAAALTNHLLQRFAKRLPVSQHPEVMAEVVAERTAFIHRHLPQRLKRLEAGAERVKRLPHEVGMASNQSHQFAGLRTSKRASVNLIELVDLLRREI